MCGAASGPEDPGGGIRQDIHPSPRRLRRRARPDRPTTTRPVPGRAGRAGGGGPVVVGDVPQQPPGFQPRAELLAELDRGRAGGAGGARGDRDARGGQDAAGRGVRAGRSWRRAGGWWPGSTPTDPGSLLAGLAAVAEAAGAGRAGLAADAGRVVRRWLEADGDRCLLVFDNADRSGCAAAVSARGAGRRGCWSPVTGGRWRSWATAVGVEVFTAEEAVAFLAGRTGLADPEGAAEVADGAGVSAAGAGAGRGGDRRPAPGYGTYLERLRALPVDEYLTREAGTALPARGGRGGAAVPGRGRGPVTGPGRAAG